MSLGRLSQDAVRLIIFEEQPMFLAGLAALVGADPTIELVATAETADAAIEATAELRPDVVIMDPHLSVGDGLEVVARLAGPTGAPPRVMALSNLEAPESVIDCLRAGAHGFVLKRSPAAHLLEAVHTINAGRTPVDSALTHRLLQPLIQVVAVSESVQPKPVVASCSVPGLSGREAQIVHALVRGLSTNEIALELCVETCTVKTHISHILAKWGVRDRVQLIHRAHAAGFVGATGATVMQLSPSLS